jgi:hypothetical protein
MLRRLSLQRSRVTDAGVRNIAQLKDLEELFLTGAPITDESVPALASLTKLRTLSVTDTEITDEGLRRLRQALPEADIRGGKRPRGRASE